MIKVESVNVGLVWLARNVTHAKMDTLDSLAMAAGKPSLFSCRV